MFQHEVKNIYIGEYVEPVWDYYVENYTNKGGNTSYYFGVCFTPNKNCSITAVNFLGNSNFSGTGTLKIAQGNHASINGNTYSITQSNTINGIYELETPYQLIADTQYVISFKGNNINDILLNTSVSGYPFVGTNITFNYACNSNYNTPYKDRAYCISGIQTS